MASSASSDSLQPSESLSLPARLFRSLRQKGLGGVVMGVRRRLDEWMIRRRADRLGNVVQIHGIKLDLTNPAIPPTDKLIAASGDHEVDEVRLMEQFLDTSLPTVEFGGSMGVVACLTNKQLQNPGDHVVVEASTPLVPTLEANRRLNDCKFEIINAAVAYGTPTIEFHVGYSVMGGSIRSGGQRKVVVPTISLKQILESHGFDVINLIVDIEGAEIQLVANELEVFKKHVKLFFVETHERVLMDGSTGKMLESLKLAGFQMLDSGLETSDVFVFRNQALVGTTL